MTHEMVEFLLVEQKNILNRLATQAKLGDKIELAETLDDITRDLTQVQEYLCEVYKYLPMRFLKGMYKSEHL